MGYKGFQAVETKANKRDKNKVRSEEHEAEFSPTAAAFRAEPKPQTKTEAEKSKRLPGENPIDPKQVKADLKAARSLQKVYASQTTSAATAKPQQQPKQQQPKVEKVDLGAWGTTTKPANAATSVSIPTHSSGGGWGAKNNGIRGAGVLSEASNFVALPSSGPEPQEDRRHYGGPKQAPKEDALANWTAAKTAQKKGGNKPAQPTHVAATLVVGKKVVAPKHTDAVVADDVEEVVAGADGAALPISVAAVVLTADGKNKEIPLSGSLDKMATKCEQYIGGMPKNANAVANLPIRAGLFMTVAGKKFSDASTLYEPWMVESYFKALTELVSGEADVVTARPYYQHKEGAAAAEAEEGEVTMRIIRASPKDGLMAPTTAIELEHNPKASVGIRAQVKKVRVSFKSFSSGMLRAGEQLVAFRESLEDVIEASPLKGAAGAEITKKFAGKFNMTLAGLKKALDAAAPTA